MTGHTHEDVDQFFSRISTKLQKTNVPTLPDLLRIVPQSYSHPTTAQRIQTVYDVKHWLEPVMEPMTQHSRPHQFKITRDCDGRARLYTKDWSTTESWQEPVGVPHILTGHPEGSPDVVTANFEKIDLRRLSQHIAKMEPFMAPAAREVWQNTLMQLHAEERGIPASICWHFGFDFKKKLRGIWLTFSSIIKI